MAVIENNLLDKKCQNNLDKLLIELNKKYEPIKDLIWENGLDYGP